MFTGKVYVKGHYNNPECRVDYSKPSEDGRPLGGIKLSHGACDMDRQRMISPQGMQFSAVLVVSFHPLFITKIDRAFNIKCMYRELTRTVSSQLEVSMLTTTQLEHTFPMPSCTYTIRKDEIDGEILRYARVGEQVVHRWECQSEVYGILVHSCFVEDGQGEKQLIVDKSGCHTDRFLLGDPTYVEALNMAYRESHVFKFADRVAVRFQCEIRLCLKEDGGCNGITPPACSDANRRPSERLTQPDNSTTDATPTNATDASSTTTASPSTTSASARLRHRFIRAVPNQPQTHITDGSFDFRPIDGDLFSQYLYVLDSVEEPKHEGTAVVDRGSGVGESSGANFVKLLSLKRPELGRMVSCIGA
uniref:ZP domain-containing protein n=1 Tax=Plectus sambesii TaxID=2011161 RepID=A0A914UV67_9BILA